MSARPISLRPYLPADAEKLAAIFRESVEVLCEDDYSDAQREASASLVDDVEGFGQKLAGELTLIAPTAYPRSANLVVRYRGKVAAPAVLFLGHLDVVEARSEDWSVDPFRFTEKDGWYYGRGAIDMKDDDAALLEALIRLRREHYVPVHDLIFAFTADEEAGGDANGPAYLLRAHRELIEAKLAVNLDGGGVTASAPILRSVRARRPTSPSLCRRRAPADTGRYPVPTTRSTDWRTAWRASRPTTSRSC